MRANGRSHFLVTAPREGFTQAAIGCEKEVAHLEVVLVVGGMIMPVFCYAVTFPLHVFGRRCKQRFARDQPRALLLRPDGGEIEMVRSVSSVGRARR